MVELSEICKKCGGKCCTKIPYGVLSKADLDRLRKHGWVPKKIIKLTETLFIDTALMSGTAFQESKGEDCPFFKGGRCTIYEDRPITCRLYPVGLEPLISEGKVFLRPFVCPDKWCPLREHINLDDLDFLKEEARLFVKSLKEQGNDGFKYYLIRPKKSLIGL